MKSIILTIVMLGVVGCSAIGVVPTSAPSDTPTLAVAGNTTLSIADVDPCKAFDQIAASNFFGSKANIGVKNTGANSASCTYTSAVSGDHMAFTVLYEDGVAKDSADFTSAKTASTTPIADLGDDAYFNKTTFLLTVARYHWMVTLSGAQKGKNVTSDALIKPVKLAMARLPH